MEFFSPAATVLTLSFVIGHHNSLTDGDAAMEPSLNDTVNDVRWKEAFQKRDETKPAPLCGRIKIHNKPIGRGKNIFKDDDDIYDDDDEDEHLDKIMGGRGIKSSSFTIRVGDHRLDYTDSHEVTFEVDKIIIHERNLYTASFENEIAFVKIKAKSDGRGIRFNDYVQPICLPLSSTANWTSLPVTSTGWGFTSMGDRQSYILKMARRVIASNTVCSKAFGSDFITPRSFCTTDPYSANQMCLGDVGAPDAFLGAGYAVLAGLHVYHSMCGSAFSPSISVSVPAQRAWIVGTISRNSRGSEGLLPVLNTRSG